MKTFTSSKTIKRMLLVLLVCSLITGTLTACGSKKKQSGITTFTVGFDAEFPPYGYKDDNGEYVGFDLSLAQEVCKRNGWELVKQPIDWDSKDMELIRLFSDVPEFRNRLHQEVFDGTYERLHDLL